MVSVIRARVQDVFVGEELDVADFEDHVQSKLETCVFEDLGGFELGGRQRRDDAGVGETGERFDIVRIPSR